MLWDNWRVTLFVGYISISDWCQAMEETTHLGLPWRMLKDKLVRTDPDTRRVRYMDTFDLSTSVSINNHDKSIMSKYLPALYTCTVYRVTWINTLELRRTDLGCWYDYMFKCFCSKLYISWTKPLCFERFNCIAMTKSCSANCNCLNCSRL